jgi:glycosyltransferase involved in cell wall biosynthesis
MTTETGVVDPLRLAFVASASIHSIRWMSYFARRGHVVRWFATSTADRELPGVTCEPLAAAAGGGRAWSVAASVSGLRKGLARFAPDVVHAHYAGVPGVLASLAGTRPLVLTAWGSDVLFAGRRPATGLPIRWALRRADLVTCDAEHMAQALAGVGVQPGRIARINFGTDVDRFQPVPRDPALDARLDLPPGPRVISIRNLHPVYDLATLVRAIPVVLRSVPDATFIVGGTGPDAPMLSRLATTLGVGGRVRFCGAIANEALPAYFAAADVYVSTARSDAGLAASTQEAMACSVAAVVTSSGENSNWIDDGVNGYVVAPGDAEALARRIAALLLDPALRRRMAAGGRALIAERSNHVIEMQKMEALYYEVRA